MYFPYDLPNVNPINIRLPSSNQGNTKAIPRQHPGNTKGKPRGGALNAGECAGGPRGTWGCLLYVQCNPKFSHKFSLGAKKGLP